MRDAFGGVFMIRIMLVFIFLFVFFIAIAFNYAKAFKIKNDIVNYIEQHQVIINDKTSIGSSAETYNDFENAIAEITEKYGYGVTCDKLGASREKPCINGVIINPVDIDTEIGGVNYRYYDVYVVVNNDLGFLKMLLTLTSETDNSDMSGVWYVSGKTKAIIS